MTYTYFRASNSGKQSKKKTRWNRHGRLGARGFVSISRSFFPRKKLTLFHFFLRCPIAGEPRWTAGCEISHVHASRKHAICLLFHVFHVFFFFFLFCNCGSILFLIQEVSAAWRFFVKAAHNDPSRAPHCLLSAVFVRSRCNLDV